MDVSREWILCTVAANPGITQRDIVALAVPSGDVVDTRRAADLVKKKLRSMAAWGDVEYTDGGSIYSPRRYYARS